MNIFIMNVGIHFCWAYISNGCVYMLLQSCPTLCHPVDYNPPGSSVHGVLQARILEWVVMPSSRGSSRPRGQSHMSCLRHWQMVSFTTSATWEVPTKTPWSQINDKINFKGFPGGPVVKNLLCSTGGAGSIPGPGRSHMPWGN